jgi:hypothetical protein
MIHTDLTIIYYTSNYLDEHNPYFVDNTKRVLKEAIQDTPLISVSHKPMDFGENICVGDIGRSNRNIYWQILTGAIAAKTKYVAMAEDDVLYPRQHFQGRPISDDTLWYDMNKWSIFTWSKPMVFSWRHRMIIFSLICTRDLLVRSLTERLEKFPAYDTQFCGEPGRYDRKLGLKPISTEEGWGGRPMVVFSHPLALGYVSTPVGREHPVGENKALGPLRGTELVPWGTADQVMKLYDENHMVNQCPYCGHSI